MIKVTKKELAVLIQEQIKRLDRLNEQAVNPYATGAQLAVADISAMSEAVRNNTMTMANLEAYCD